MTKKDLKISMYGFYLSSKGDESPKHRQACKVVNIYGDEPLLFFKNRRLGPDSLNLGAFVESTDAVFADDRR